MSKHKKMVQTETHTIVMNNGIELTLTVVDDGTYTNATMVVNNEMEILSGSQLSHVGGRPKHPK